VWLYIKNEWQIDKRSYTVIEPPSPKPYRCACVTSTAMVPITSCPDIDIDVFFFCSSDAADQHASALPSRYCMGRPNGLLARPRWARGWMVVCSSTRRSERRARPVVTVTNAQANLHKTRVSVHIRPRFIAS
jgi:hypothetical protein